MKPIFLLTLCFALHIRCFICDCDVQSFMGMVPSADLTFKGLVIEKEVVPEVIIDRVASVKILITRLYYGKEQKEVVTIQAHNPLSTCQLQRIGEMELNQEYMINLSKYTGDYMLVSCGISFLKIEEGVVLIEDLYSGKIDPMRISPQFESGLEKTYGRFADRAPLSRKDIILMQNKTNDISQPIGMQKVYANNGLLTAMYFTDSLGIQGNFFHFGDDGKLTGVVRYENNKRNGKAYLIKGEMPKSLPELAFFKDFKELNIPHQLISKYNLKENKLNGAQYKYNKSKVATIYHFENGEYIKCEQCNEF